MLKDERQPEDLLLDWHLNQLDENKRLWLEAELERDAELRSNSERLGRILQPLDHWHVPPPESDLPDRVLAYVAKHAGANSGVVRPAPTADRPIPFPGLRMRDLIAAAACIALIVGVAVPGAGELRSRSQRAVCARHLASVFGGVSTYRQDFDESLPFAGQMVNAAWLPGGATDRPYASNSRHMYLLLKLGSGPTPEDFICPASRTAVAMQLADVASRDDFPSTCNVSFAALNLAGARPNLRPVTPMAYIGDTNPLFVGARFNHGVDPERTNSPAHGGRGQTVLTLDGRTRWMTEPVYGADRDNLWMIGNIRHYTGVETPAQPNDVQLLPGFPATDPEVCRALRN